VTELPDEQSETVDTVALIMAAMPDEARIDLLLSLSDLYKEQAERQLPSLSHEVMTQSRRNFIMAIIRRVSELEAAAGVAPHPQMLAVNVDKRVSLSPSQPAVYARGCVNI
jgi:hypothetical protein